MSKIQTNLVIEILGRPAENVKEALNTLVTKLGSEAGVKIIGKTCYDPIPAENSKNLFTAFAEITVEYDSLYNFFGVLFAYMPSHVELMHPEKITLTNTDLNDVANKLVARLHEYDSITKKALIERELLAKKLHEMAPHLFQKAEEKQQPEKPKKNTKKSAKDKKEK